MRCAPWNHLPFYGFSRETPLLFPKNVCFRWHYSWLRDPVSFGFVSSAAEGAGRGSGAHTPFSSEFVLPKNLVQPMEYFMIKQHFANFEDFRSVTHVFLDLHYFYSLIVNFVPNRWLQVMGTHGDYGVLKASNRREKFEDQWKCRVSQSFPGNLINIYLFIWIIVLCHNAILERWSFWKFK